jgi:hypothetical protein
MGGRSGGRSLGWSGECAARDPARPRVAISWRPGPLAGRRRRGQVGGDPLAGPARHGGNQPAGGPLAGSADGWQPGVDPPAGPTAWVSPAGGPLAGVGPMGGQPAVICSLSRWATRGPGRRHRPALRAIPRPDRRTCGQPGGDPLASPAVTRRLDRRQIARPCGRLFGWIGGWVAGWRRFAGWAGGIAQPCGRPLGWTGRRVASLRRSAGGAGGR